MTSFTTKLASGLLAWLDRRIDARISEAAERKRRADLKRWWDGLSPYWRGVELGSATTLAQAKPEHHAERARDLRDLRDGVYE